MARSTAHVVLAFAVVYVVWGSTYAAILLALGPGVGPLGLGGARFLLAGAMLGSWAWLRGERWPSARAWREGAILGGLFFFVGNGAVCWAEAEGLPTGTAAILVATVPLWVALLSWRTRHGPHRTAMSGRALAGLAIGFGGVAWLVTSGRESSAAPPLPTVIVLVGALGWAIGSLRAARVGQVAGGGLTAPALQMICGGGMMLVGAAVSGESVPTLSEVPTSAWLSFAYLVIFGSIVAFSGYSWLLRHVAPARVATYAYVNPVVAVALGWGLGETLRAEEIVAMGLALCGVALTLAGRARAGVSPSATGAPAGAPARSR
jgi:drug/metabolite transporter (DMT)-like permease